MRNTLYRKKGKTLPKSTALFYKYTQKNSSVDIRTRPVTLNFIYLCVYLFFYLGPVVQSV
jgi:hypothetical protein